MPVVPESRVAIFRSVIYLFVILDMHAIVRDPVPLSHHPELYQPLWIESLLPAPSVPLAYTLYVVLIVSCLVAAANRLPRLAGWVVAPAFTWWTAIGFSYGKVDHDHLALVVALWTLPTVGAIAGRWRSVERSARAGWALKCVQIAVIGTYFLSWVAKMSSTHGMFSAWPSSFILTWAIVRRPHGLGQFLLPYPWLLHLMQWGSFLAEMSSPVVLWLRGRALRYAAVFWLGFHVFTIAMIYIHFAPTVICWLAFAPLERIAPWWRARRERRRTPQPVEPAGQDPATRVRDRRRSMPAASSTTNT